MQTITWDDITLSFCLNRDRTINLRKQMTVKYKDAKGNEVILQMYPVHDKDKNGTIKNQLDTIKHLIKNGQNEKNCKAF